MMQQTNENLKSELTNMKRNPYLENYAQNRSIQGHGKRGQTLDSFVRQAPRSKPYGKRKSHVQISRQRIWILLAGAACAFCLLLIQGFTKPDSYKTAPFGEMRAEIQDSTLSVEKIQGISAEAYHKHPDWTEDFLRHYDCGGKKCPLYYTEHEDAWEQLKRDVTAL